MTQGVADEAITLARRRFSRKCAPLLDPGVRTESSSLNETESKRPCLSVRRSNAFCACSANISQKQRKRHSSVT